MIPIDTLAFALGWIVFAMVATAGLLWWRTEPSTRVVVSVALTWAVVVTLPYWVLGPSSYLYGGDEAAIPVANYLQWIKHFEGGSFMHATMGGLDPRSSIVGLGGFISIERLLLAAFPLWIAVLVQKVAVLLVGFTGAYALAREAGGATRGHALAIALAASVAHHFLTVATFHNGLGYALGPWFLLLIAHRADTRQLGPYWTAVAVLLAINAVSSLPTHTFFATAGVALLGTLLLGVRRWWRVAGAMAAAVAAYLINWHEGVSGVLALAPFTTRVALSSAPENWGQVLGMAWPSAGYGRIAIVAMFASIFILWWARDPRALRATAVGVLAAWGGPALIMFPFAVIGLKPLGAINYAYINFCIPALTVILVAWAAPLLAAKSSRMRVAPVVAAAACAAVIWQMSQDFFYLLTDGGQKNFAIGNLSEPAWARGADARVVTVPFRLRPNYMLAYGLETMDGQFSIVPRAFLAFARAVRQGKGEFSLSGSFTITPRFDPLCCERYAAHEMMDLGPLRLGNVGFVVSTLPLVDVSLTRVSGAPVEVNPYMRDKPLRYRLEVFWQRIFSPDDAWVYAIADPLPRVFFAGRVTAVPDHADDDEVLAQAVHLLNDRAAVVRAADAAILNRVMSANGNTPNARVLGYDKIADGYAVRFDARNGGVLMVNTPFLPFWKARLNGKPLAIVPANTIHMAVAVPAGSGEITLSFERPGMANLLGTSASLARTEAADLQHVESGTGRR
jgi:hypothetical protein